MTTEPEAILEATTDAVLLFDPEGRLRQATRRARERLVYFTGQVPSTFAELRELVSLHRVDGEPLDDAAVGRAMRGEIAELELLIGGPERERRLHVTLAPLRDEAGRPTGVVAVSRDITNLYAAIAGRAHLHGARTAVRRVAHELNDKLGAIIAHGEMVPTLPPIEAASAARIIVEAASTAAKVLRQSQRIVRFEEADLGVGAPVLDLEASADPTP
jgi:nitrogen fixation/metabolism regulation signal transduction histidine kinase